MSLERNSNSEDNDIDILSSLINPINHGEQYGSNEINHAISTGPQTQAPVPVTVDQKLDLLLSKMENLDKLVNYSNTAIQALSKIVAKDKKRIIDLTAENVKLKESLNVMTLKQDLISSRLSDLESHEFKTQLILSNVPETRNEGTTKFCLTLLKNMGIDLGPREVSHAYRIGKFIQDRRRPILIKFSSQYDRQIVWDKRGDTPDHIYMKQVYPEQIATQRRILQQIVNKARSMDQYREKAYLRHNRIVINDTSYTVDNLAELPDDLKVVVGCDEMDNTVYFYGLQCPLSNFYQAKFTVDGIKFSCVEQAYFYRKAVHYGNSDTSAQILAETRPRIHKRLGESFGKRDWNDPGKALNHMASIVAEKFRQNPYLKAVLLSTGSRDLAEANPYDSYWGIGSSAKTAISRNGRWPGNNTMGTIMVDVRNLLRNETQ
jgi:ribA/ribD-fused uncharacterized protein